MNIPGLNILKTILTRTVFFYLVCGLLVWHMLDYHQFINNAVPQTMSRLTPPVDYFKEFVDRDGNYDRFKLMDCIYYHKKVAGYFVYQKAEALGMLGFCYERSGERPQAIDAYQQAIASNPNYFWPYYDLGVIYYDQAQYARAADYLQQAVEQDPVKSIILLTRSKVYTDVSGGQYDFIQGLKQGRVQAYALLMDSLTKTGSYGQLGRVAIYGLKEGLGEESLFYYYAGLAAFNQKSFVNAIGFLHAAIQADPYNADAYYYLGLCLRLAGKDDLAGVFLSQAAQLHQHGDSEIKKYLKARVRFF